MESLVDFFVVCGLPPDAFQPFATSGAGRRALQPQVLVHYPEAGAFDEAAVRTLCMPDGVTFKKNLTGDPLDHIEFHTFILTREDGSHSYGCVATYFESLSDDIVSSLFRLQKEGQFLSLPFELELGDTVHVSKCVSTVAANPVIAPLKDFLVQLVHSVHSGSSPDVPLESLIYQLLFQLTMPTPGQTISFVGPQRKIIWQYPESTHLPLLDYSMQDFVELVGLRNLIMLYTTVLLEHQLLLQSSSYSQLMLCAQCTAALLYPFEWQHVFVPILPFAQRDFLDAPVPFIMGIKVTKSDTNMEFPEVSSLCIFDIDQNTFTSSDELPKLPMEADLLRKIRKSMETYDVKCFDMQIAPLPAHEESRSKSKGSIMEAVEYVTSQLKGSSNGSILNDTSNPHVEKLLSIMSRLPIKDSPVGAGARNDSVPEQKQNILSVDQLFSTDLCEVFFNYMVELFADYEDFVIIPQQSYEQWTRDREQFQNFDKTSFLSDQSPSTVPFLSSFIESQMFSHFIDQKIVALWQSPDVHNRIIAFDDRIKTHFEKTGRFVPQSPQLKPQSDPAVSPPIIVDTPMALSEGPGTCQWEKGVFPRLTCDSILKRSPQAIVIPTKKSNPAPERGLKLSSVSGASFSLSSHSQFILQLWRETRMRVKHILSTDADSVTGMEEENTMIAKLCDLLERIWGHGVRKRNSRSPLWSHLLAYCDSHQVGNAESLDTTMQPGDMSTSISFSSESPHSNRTESLRLHLHRQKVQSPENKSKIKSIIAPPQPSFFEDLKIINSIPEIKTEVGRVRAFVRLALEKKVLAHHLKLLLANHGLLNQIYQAYAFLRTEEEREQFLTFLLTLSARHYMCFTSAFKNAVMSYRVLVLGEGKHLGLSTITLHCNLSGEFRSSGVKMFTRGSNELEFQCFNLGAITCLRIGHDNSGAVKSLFVHSVIAHNVTTGQIYKFACDRWLSKSEDDCAVERFLVGELIPADAIGRISDESKVFPAKFTKKSKIAFEDEEASDLLAVKTAFDASVGALITSSKQSSKGLNQHGLILQHVYNGFASAFTRLLLFDFQPRSKYPFYWDYLSTVLLSNKLDVPQSLFHSVQTLLQAVGKIEGHCLSIGKEERFAVLLGVGLRDKLLLEWIKVIVSISIFSQSYGPESVFKDPELQQHLFTAIQQLTEVDLPMGDLFLLNL